MLKIKTNLVFILLICFIFSPSVNAKDRKVRRFDSNYFLEGSDVQPYLPNITSYVNYTQNIISVHHMPNALSPVLLNLNPNQLVYLTIQNGAVIQESGWLQVRIGNQSNPGYLYDPVFSTTCLQKYRTLPARVGDIFYAKSRTEVKNIPNKKANTIQILQAGQSIYKKSVLTRQNGEQWIEVQSGNTIGYVFFNQEQNPYSLP